MTQLKRQLPSIPEVLELASLVPSKKPPSPNIARLLQPFIDICRPQWISDFLFTSEPIHLEHFLSPSFSSKSFVCAYNTTRIEAASLQPDPEPLYEETHHLEGRCLFLPAFTLGDITLGFGAMEVMANTGPFWYPNFQRRCAACLPMRFIRDTKRNIFLEVFDIPMGDAVMVYLTRYISPTRTHTVNAMFTRSILHASLREQSDPDIIDKLTTSLQFIAEEDQTRACHICNALHGGICLCAMQPSKPIHPFDGNSFARNMMQHLGVRQSLSNKILFDAGSQRRHVCMGTRMLMQGSIDPGFVQRISSWVATEYLNYTAPNPRASIMLVSYHVEELGDIFNVDESQLHIVHKPSSSKAPTSESVLQNMIDDVLGLDELQFGNERTLQTNDLGPNSASETNLLEGIDITGAQVSDAQPLNRGYTFTFAPNPDDVVQEDWWTERCDITNSEPLLPDHLFASQQQSDQSSSAPQPQLPSTGTDSSDRATNTPPVAKSTDVPDETLIAKRIKAQIRREKNRLCAQRSNKRAKAVRDALKADLQASKEKAELLRSKEMALRHSNLELRRSLEQAK